MIRSATSSDVAAMLEIYAPCVRETTYTFEYDVPSMADFMSRFERISSKYPWIVWEEDGKVLGYAYADTVFSRAAYAWDADTSIYLSAEARGRGIGGKLYACLEALVALQGYHNLYGIVTGENAASMRFHEKCGYERLFTLKTAGFKLGRWVDVHWYGKRLCEANPPDSVPKVFAWGTEELRTLEKYV